LGKLVAVAGGGVAGKGWGVVYLMTAGAVAVVDNHALGGFVDVEVLLATVSCRGLHNGMWVVTGEAETAANNGGSIKLAFGVDCPKSLTGGWLAGNQSKQ
jgi:hypothetical protein